MHAFGDCLLHSWVPLDTLQPTLACTNSPSHWSLVYSSSTHLMSSGRRNLVGGRKGCQFASEIHLIISYTNTYYAIHLLDSPSHKVCFLWQQRIFLHTNAYLQTLNTKVLYVRVIPCILQLQSASHYVTGPKINNDLYWIYNWCGSLQGAQVIHHTWMLV